MGLIHWTECGSAFSPPTPLALRSKMAVWWKMLCSIFLLLSPSSSLNVIWYNCNFKHIFDTFWILTDKPAYQCSSWLNPYNWMLLAVWASTFVSMLASWYITYIWASKDALLNSLWHKFSIKHPYFYDFVARTHVGQRWRVSHFRHPASVHKGTREVPFIWNSLPIFLPKYKDLLYSHSKLLFFFSVCG